MADRIIKSDSGNDVVIQNNGGTRKIEVTNSGDVEVTGDFKATTVKATNLKANDGTASLEIADSTGDIGFSGNTNLKFKLPSAGGIYESDGSTEILTESSGTVSLKNTTINSNNTFPSGHVINTVTDTYSRSSSVSHSTTGSIDYGSDLSVTITPSASTNKIIIILQIPDINNGSTANASLHIGMRKSTDGFVSNDTQFGERQYPWAFINYTNTTDNLVISTTFTTVGTLGGTDTFTLRPEFKAQGSTPTSFTNASNTSFDLASLIAMEISP